MTVYELMAKLGAAGIKLWVEEGQLKFKAPKGALTPELKQAAKRLTGLLQKLLP